MKFYKDKESKEVVEKINVGLVTAGETITSEFYVEHEGNSYLRNLEFKPITDDIIVLEHPKMLKPGDIGKIVLQWKSNAVEKKKLESVLKVTGEEIF